MRRVTLVLLGACALVEACGAPRTEPADGGERFHDTTASDAELRDEGAADSALVDAREDDFGSADPGTPDGGSGDAPIGGHEDLAVDGGHADAGEFDELCVGCRTGGQSCVSSINCIGGLECLPLEPDGTKNCVQGPPPLALLCINGAGDGTHYGLSQWCETRAPIQNCNQSECAFGFAFLDAQGALEALVRELDENGDGQVDDADSERTVAIAGYSWGAFTAADVIQSFLQDSRVALSRRRVHRFVAVDPYIPTLSPHFEVPSGVELFFAYRHSISPPGDCSEAAPLGPYEGIRPRCDATSECHDYDFSLQPTDMFHTRVGSQIDHCSILWEVMASALYSNRVSGRVGNPPIPDDLPVPRR